MIWLFIGYALGLATVPAWQRRAAIWAWLNSFGKPVPPA
jgi:hypothetical protein